MPVCPFMQGWQLSSSLVVKGNKTEYSMVLGVYDGSCVSYAGVIGSSLGLVGLVSITMTGWDSKFDLQLVLVWQHILLSEQICPWDTLCMLLGHSATKKQVFIMRRMVAACHVALTNGSGVMGQVCASDEVTDGATLQVPAGILALWWNQILR